MLRCWTFVELLTVVYSIFPITSGLIVTQIWTPLSLHVTRGREVSEQEGRRTTYIYPFHLCGSYCSKSITLSPFSDRKALWSAMKLRNLPKAAQLIRWRSHNMTPELFHILFTVLFCLLREMGARGGGGMEIWVPECFWSVCLKGDDARQYRCFLVIVSPTHKSFLGCVTACVKVIKGPEM